MSGVLFTPKLIRTGNAAERFRAAVQTLTSELRMGGVVTVRGKVAEVRRPDGTTHLYTAANRETLADLVARAEELAA